MVAEINNPLGLNPVPNNTAPKPNAAQGVKNVTALPRDGAQNSRGDTVSISARGLHASEFGKTVADMARNGNPPKTVRDVTEDNRVVVKVVDPETKEVIRQVPSEDLLRLKQAVSKLVQENQSSDDS